MVNAPSCMPWASPTTPHPICLGPHQPGPILHTPGHAGHTTLLQWTHPWISGENEPKVSLEMQ
ncbi:hypothetical protein P7K49_026162, partial [Saguinus oedipus]